jgi:peptidoglycan/LPS O-acetylase OafA/YrhL
VAANLTFVSEFASALGLEHPLSLLGLWSISVEVKFYWFFSLVLFLPRSVRGYALAATLGWCLWGRYGAVMRASPNAFEHSFFVEPFLLGALSHRVDLCGRLRALLPANSAAPAMVVLFAYVLYFPSIGNEGATWFAAYLMAVVGCVLLVNLAALFTELPRVPGRRLGLALGARSYTLYVLHFQFLAWAGLAGQLAGLNFSAPRVYDLILVAGLLGGVPLLELVHRAVENPCINLARKLALRRATPAM